MKKILCGILCASAGAALAVESQVTTIDVIEVNSDLTNVVVAIPGLDLAGGDLAISNLVKTVNLKNGDKLFAFNDGTYQAWVLSGGGKWVEVALAEQDSDGKVAVAAGTPAADKRMLVGAGIWLHRQDTSKSFYIYGAHSDVLTSTAAAGKTTLVGNPTQTGKAPSIPAPSVGDQVIIPTAGLPITYTYRNSAWGYMQNGVLKTGLPSIAAGTGFWYVSKGESDVTINWW